VELEPAPLQTEPPSETNGTLTPRDGRTIGYAQYGDPSGKPVFFFHGGAGSGLEHPADVCAIGARLICTDRPGHGLSDLQPDRYRHRTASGDRLADDSLSGHTSDLLGSLRLKEWRPVPTL
jgi:pimeloyl-ACP methyl ester carboxylesterase